MALKLLVVRFSSIGDIVLTSPVVRCLKTQLGDVEIHFLTKQRFAFIAEANPYIEKVWSFEKQLQEVLPSLKAEKYDQIIDLHNNIRSHFVIFSLLKPWRSFNKLNTEKWLMVRFKIDRLPKVHIVERYLNTVAHLGVINDGIGLDFFIPAEQEINVELSYPQLSGGFIAFVIGGNHNTKLLPADMVADVINKLSLPAVLLGGREDDARGVLIEEMTKGRGINLCGKLSLMASASLVRQSKAVISNDTGLMHIAAAFDKPMVSVWGNTIPGFGMYPYTDASAPSMFAEVKGLNCRPCSKIGYKECPLKHFNCMRMQDLSKIAGYVNGLSV